MTYAVVDLPVTRKKATESEYIEYSRGERRERLWVAGQILGSKSLGSAQVCKIHVQEIVTSVSEQTKTQAVIWRFMSSRRMEVAK